MNIGVKKKTLNKYGVKQGGLGSLFSGGVPTLKKRSQPSPENSSVSEEKHVIASPPVLRKTSVPSVSAPNLYNISLQWNFDCISKLHIQRAYL